MTDTNIYYSIDEIQDPDQRENKLFGNFTERLNSVVTLSAGWKKLLENTDINAIKNREDLKNIPITRKSSLIELQKKNPPYGNLTLKEPGKFSYSFASPGPIYEPGEVGDFWNMSSSLYAAGLRPGNLVYNTFSYHLGPAGILIGNGASCIGSAVFPGGVGNTDLQISTIKTIKPKFYLGTPSFLKIILDRLHKEKNQSSIFENALVGAEAFPNDLREYFISKYNICPLQMYGTAEVGCIAYESKNEKGFANQGMIVEENIILEIVRPGSNQQVAKGEVGEVVITKLNSDYPMIRLATGDLSAIIDEPSPCGRTNTRIKGWMGRAEQSTKIKGLFITPEQINKINVNFKNLSKVRLVIEKKDMLDFPILLCETKGQKVESKDIKKFFKEKFKLNVEVQIVSRGTIANDGIVIDDKRINN